MMSILTRFIDKRISAYQNTLLATHYAEVDNMYRQIRGWRHDYKNHMQVLMNYAQAKDYTAITDYLAKLSDDLSTIDTVIKTGNKMLDAILNSKISLARSRHVAVTAEAQISIALTTPEIDLCAIIGNLFDNAIEASLSLPEEERLIRVFMEIKGRHLYMSFTNRSAVKKQIKVFGRFKSLKGSGHGFGLVRVDHIVEKLGGYLSRNSEDGAFTTEILLPQG
jgi:sensor histidine kinase regulating citrate/malate metabolism